MIYSCLAALIGFELIRSTSPAQQPLMVALYGMIMAGIIPCIMTVQHAHTAIPDQPYAQVVETRRMRHQSLINLEKQAALNPQDADLSLQLAEILMQEERFLEAAKAFAQAESVGPLADQAQLRAAECLIYGSQGFLVPQAKIWLTHIPSTSPFRSRADFLLENFSSPLVE